MSTRFKLIVGLGNPGKQYARTRHNLGFQMIDVLVKAWGASPAPSQHRGEVYCVQRSGTLGHPPWSLFLIKPQTFMNLSGQCVAPWVRFYLKNNQTLEDLIVLHDDLDIPHATFRLKKGGGTAGHNGLRSIAECLGKDQTEYYRVRLGIGKPGVHPRLADLSTPDFVLTPFSEEEQSSWNLVFEQVQEAMDWMLQGKTQEAMTRFHQTTPPQARKASL